MANLRSKVGEVTWHGGKSYSVCEYCNKRVQLNKVGLGSLHICIPAYDRAILDGEIATKEHVAEILARWRQLEDSIKDKGRVGGAKDFRKPTAVEYAKALVRSRELDADIIEPIQSLAQLMKDLGNNYKSGYEYGNWITIKTAENLGYSLEVVEEAISRIGK